MEEITKDPNRNYLEEEPFFTKTADGRKLLLLSAEWWKQATDEEGE